MWGRLTDKEGLIGALGITPTHVGTTLAGLYIGTVNEDNPHTCGDDLLKRDLKTLRRG